MGEAKNKIKLFEEKQVRAVWDEEAEKWWFSIIDVVAVLTDSIDPTAYWRKLKQRLTAEGNETVTNCHGLKLLAPDGRMRLTDVADTEQILRLIQSVPSKKAEPFKLWLAKTGNERIDETVDPELSILTKGAAAVVSFFFAYNLNHRGSCKTPVLQELPFTISDVILR